MGELRNLLAGTIGLQGEFAAQRSLRSLPKILAATPPAQRPLIEGRFRALGASPAGLYCLMDYVNFKGEGLNTSGGYNGQNWGLLQVLEDMQPSQPGQQALHSFADAASRVLARRVRNSPPARNEARWLAGWSSRVNTYRYPGV